MRFKKSIAALAAGISLLSFTSVQSQIKLPALVRDSMILQRDTKLPVWGWASKGEKVSVQFLGKTYKATTGTDGKWSVTLPALKAGGPFTMTISGSNKIMLKDILVGDVWFCSGQSNMVHQMKLHRDRYETDIQAANNPMIRHVFIPTLTSISGPKDDFPPVYWKSAIPADVTEFSAVAYFFARKIYDHYKVPMGLINASVGGTPIEAWISEEGFASFPGELATLQKNKDTAYVNGRSRGGFGGNRGGRSTVQTDKGLAGPKQWFDMSYEPKVWHTINVPGYWEDQGVKDLNGVVWYRKEINVPQQMTGKAAKLVLGRIVDADNAYINGVQVGNTTYMYPQRRYAVPAGVLKAGKNLIVVRVTNTNGKGGFVPDKPYYLVAGNDSVDLKGTWSFKVGEVFEPISFRGGGGVPAGAGGAGVGPINGQNQPAGLYNAMVAPATRYKVKGFLWYQGEANSGKPKEYEGFMRALVESWRKVFQADNAPFLWVQLPGFMDRTYLPSESNWAGVRESQLKALSVPNTGMAVAIDLGEWNDIHPDNKKEVGERLALIGEKLAYGNNDIIYSGPIYQSSKIEGNKIILSFKYTGSGLITIDGEPLSQFAIAGADKKFVWANARIEGNTVVVSSDQVSDPKFVRYAWADNPEDANLFNKEGLPASPFRTDE